jgi:hypothetical protein
VGDAVEGKGVKQGGGKGDACHVDITTLRVTVSSSSANIASKHVLNWLQCRPIIKMQVIVVGEGGCTSSSIHNLKSVIIFGISKIRIHFPKGSGYKNMK